MVYEGLRKTIPQPFFSSDRIVVLREEDGYALTSKVRALSQRRFVEAHGGQVSVESEPGQDSTFRFTVPHEAGVE